MIEGICTKCGRKFYGWALLQPCNQACQKCGIGLLITEDGKKTIQGYSPFTAEEYKFKSPYQICPDTERTKNTNKKE
jgi:hypothetical protein